MPSGSDPVNTYSLLNCSLPITVTEDSLPSMVTDGVFTSSS